ncbi:MAG: hypothetical protein Q4D77_00285 [Peptostreptococcaceae bacterium]|nr:hypothetical protein [Peptostreptococcaceae bacterium]
MRNMERELFQERTKHLDMKYKTTDLVHKPGFVYSIIFLLAIFDMLTIYQPIDNIFTEMQYIVIALSAFIAGTLELVPTMIAITLKTVKDKTLKKRILISLGALFTIVFLGVGIIRLSSARDMYGLGKSLNLGQAAEERSLSFAQYSANVFLFLLPLVSSVLAFLLAFFQRSIEETKLYKLCRDRLKLEEKLYLLQREKEFISERYHQLIEEKKAFYETLLESYEPYLIEVCKNALTLHLNNANATDRILTPNELAVNSETKVVSFDSALKKESN